MPASEHPMSDFLSDMQRSMADDYRRIRGRAGEDPGTAGDEGENSWSALLSLWLPQEYQIITKGRIIFPDGHSSPQVDVLVLAPWYPKAMLHGKYMLSCGVVAGFECKLTLRPHHIKAAAGTAAEIARHVGINRSTPYDVLHSPIIYGLLAHSHDWKGPESTPLDNVSGHLKDACAELTTFPREAIDYISVADLGTWRSNRFIFLWRQAEREAEEQMRSLLGNSYHSPREAFGESGTTQVGYMVSVLSGSKQPNPVSDLICHLFYRLGYVNESIRGLVEYTNAVQELQADTQGLTVKSWDASFYPEPVRDALESPDLIPRYSPLSWNRWGQAF
jgi:hypothetical protein